MELPQLAELERVQTGLLNGILNIDLSLSLLSKQRPLRRLQRRHSAAEARLSAILRPNGVSDFVFVKAPPITTTGILSPDSTISAPLLFITAIKASSCPSHAGTSSIPRLFKLRSGRQICW